MIEKVGLVDPHNGLKDWTADPRIQFNYLVRGNDQVLGSNFVNGLYKQIVGATEIQFDSLLKPSQGGYEETCRIIDKYFKDHWYIGKKKILNWEQSAGKIFYPAMCLGFTVPLPELVRFGSMKNIEYNIFESSKRMGLSFLMASLGSSRRSEGQIKQANTTVPSLGVEVGLCDVNLLEGLLPKELLIDDRFDFDDQKSLVRVSPKINITLDCLPNVLSGYASFLTKLGLSKITPADLLNEQNDQLLDNWTDLLGVARQNGLRRIIPALETIYE